MLCDETNKNTNVEQHLHPLSEITIQEVLNTRLLLSLTDCEDEVITTDIIMRDLNVLGDGQIASGLREKSKWTPTLHSGNNIDIFHRLVLNDLDKFDKKRQQPRILNDTLTHGERLSLRDIRNDESITIKEADKGGNIVIMASKDYDDQILSQLGDAELTQTQFGN